MQVALTLDILWAVYALAYLLVGALGTMFVQSQNTLPAMSFLKCLFWTVFWLPVGVVMLAILLFAAVFSL